MQEQNEKPISVIIGNPPYNDSAALWGDGGANRSYPEIDLRIKDTYTKEGTAQRTHQYDMYKRFLRWASDRLDDDGIVGFVTNRAYLDARQDDGFRKIAAREFSDIYVLDLGSDVRRNPKISGTTHNVFGIQTGVAIGFFVRNKAKLGQCSIHYAKREDAELAKDKLAYLGEVGMQQIDFDQITPDEFNRWLNQSVHTFRFRRLMPLANRETRSASNPEMERAMFRLFANGAKSNRDEWVYDFDLENLQAKAEFFANTYNGFLEDNDNSYDPVIKWSSSLSLRFGRKEKLLYDGTCVKDSLYRPFTPRHHYADVGMNDRLTRNHYEMFGPDLQQPNKVICFSGVASTKPFQVLATDKLPGFDLLEKTQCLPLYRYTENGERICNITDWAVREFDAHCRALWGDHFEELAGPEGITAEDIFAYTYAVLHDPVYRHDYRVDLLREFPRLPFYHEFDVWKRMGQELLDLHIGFESAEPFSLERVETNSPSTGSGRAVKVILRANKEAGTIALDDKTTLRGFPPAAWEYQLGSRSALEWVLDQYKERKPRDPTIAEKFNTYKFADYKEQVIDLLRRVCTVSVKTVEIVGRMAYWDGDDLVVSGDRDKREWTNMALASMFSHYDEADDDPEYQAWLASLPDIGKGEN